MGMFVSQLRSVPIGGFDYYVYLVDASGRDHSEAIDRFFDEFSRQSEVEAVIIRGPEGLRAELVDFLREHTAANDYQSLEDLFHDATCLVIAEGALQETTKPIHVLPLLSRGDSAGKQVPLLDAVLRFLLEVMKSGELGQLFATLSAKEIELSKIRRNLWVTKLRLVNHLLELKPNLAGVGINLNALIDQFLGPSTRRLTEGKKQ